jgi:hypothetical protein
MSWSAGSIEKVTDQLYKITDLKWSVPSNDYVRVEGSSYLATYNLHYWHFIHEDLANFEGLKQQIPDLTLRLFDIHGAVNPDTKELHQEVVDKASYLPFFLEMYPQDVTLTRDQGVIFETVYVGMTTCDIYAEGELFSEHGLYPAFIPGNPGFPEWSSSEWPHEVDYALTGIRTLAEKVRSFGHADDTAAKKIFITRKDVNARLKQLIGDPDHEHLVRTRYYQDEFLWDFFESRGYEIVCLEDMTYEEEITLFMSASHVAGPTGAGLVNLYLSNPGTKLIELMLIPDFDWTYIHFQNAFDIDYEKVDLRLYSDSEKLKFLADISYF